MAKKAIDDKTVRWMLNSKPTAIIAATKNEKLRIATISWYTPICQHPLMVALSLHEKSFTLEAISGVGAVFSLNLFGKKYIHMIRFAGAVSGRNFDKQKHANIRHVVEGGVPLLPDAFLSVPLQVTSITKFDQNGFALIVASSFGQAIAEENSHIDGKLTLSNDGWVPVYHIGEEEYVSPVESFGQ